LPETRAELLKRVIVFNGEIAVPGPVDGGFWEPIIIQCHSTDLQRSTTSLLSDHRLLSTVYYTTKSSRYLHGSISMEIDSALKELLSVLKQSSPRVDIPTRKRPADLAGRVTKTT
jgi:hypothetical protein